MRAGAEPGLGWDDGLLAAAERRAIVVTANERAARTLRRAWDAEQQRRGQTRWEPLVALSWRAWCQDLWRERMLSGATDRVLLNRVQEARLWARIVRADGAVTGHGRVEAIAGMCVEAYRRLRSYRGEARLRGAWGASLQGDLASFARWMRSFEARCERDRLQPEAGVEGELGRGMILGTCAGQELWLTGFDRLTPAQEGLLGAWRAAGGIAVEQTVNEPRRQAQLVVAEDGADELKACARWARARWRERPGVRLAVIAADAGGLRDELEAVLREVMAPEFGNVLRDGDDVPWEFSLGRPLGAEPMVQTAMDLLRWVGGPLPIERVTRLLLSPYFARGAEGDETDARAELDAMRLRGELRLRPEISVAEVAKAARRDERLRRQLPSLSRALRELASVDAGGSAGRRRFGEWIEIFRAWLRAARWAETTGLASREFQVQERWEEALDALATLDVLGEAVNLAEAMAGVERLTAQTVFAPEARDAAVQVMGPLEAAGSVFDGMWVLQSGELDWPPRSGTQALLPMTLQRELGMPGTDARRDREKARAMTRRLAAGAAEVVFSYARVGADYAEQTAAAMVEELAGRSEAAVDLAAGAEIAAAAPMEEIVEGPVRQLPEGMRLGGVKVLELQAACGFRAFAELRLGANELGGERSPGMNAMERGSAVHEAMEVFWAGMGSHAKLVESRGAARKEAIDQSVDAALARVVERGETEWDRSYLRVQRDRMAHLLARWMEMEEGRPPFKVLEQEKTLGVWLGPLELRVRVDRTDEVDGSQVVIDYKTGEAKPADWLGDRPKSPQVPLYAVMTKRAAEQTTAASEGEARPLGAVAFALVQAGKKQAMKGLEDVPGQHLPTRSRSQMDAADLIEQVERWEEVLTRLATEFAAGDARVRPKQFPVTCRYCQQRLLCRVDPAMFEVMEQIEEEEGAVGLGDEHE